MPDLFQALAEKGAQIIALPAAFTLQTGKDHWEVLLRARAIENGCFIFAPAQTGTHAGGRKTFGHALIINPWGEVLADAGTAPGVIMAAIDPAEVARARGKVPAIGLESGFTRLAPNLASNTQKA